MIRISKVFIVMQLTCRKHLREIYDPDHLECYIPVDQSFSKANNLILQLWLKTFTKRVSVIIISVLVFMTWRFRIMGANPPKFQHGDNPSAFQSNLLARVRDCSSFSEYALVQLLFLESYPVYNAYRFLYLSQ